MYDNSNAVAGVTNALGQLTTATAYRGGQAYTSQEKAFNVFGSSLGATVTIPGTEGALAGSYAFGHTYTSVLGLPLTDTYPAKGGLPSETVLHGYTGVLDLPTTLGGLAGYSQSVSYDAYGRVDQQTIGSSSSHAFVTNTYDPHTGRLTNQLVTRSTATPATSTSRSTSTTWPATSPARPARGWVPPPRRRRSATATTAWPGSPKPGPPPTPAPPRPPTPTSPWSATPSARVAPTGPAGRST